MVISLRTILGAGVVFALFAGLVSHGFTLATGTALWTLEADPSASFSYVMLMNQVYWVTWACLTPLIFRFADRFTLTSDTWKRRLPLHVAAGSAFVFAHAVLVGTGRSWLQQAYGMDTIWLVWIKQQFLRTFDWELTYYAAAVGARHAIIYYEAARDREVQAAQLETRLVEAQLQALQRQLHPHFLFNTLHAISALVRRNPDAAEEALERLGDLLRLTLQKVGAQEVTLRQELEYLRVYLDIERMHFGDRLSVTFEVDGAAYGALVPHLLLQPLVENAIRHGIAPRLAPGHVGIQAWVGVGQLLLRVWDNGVGLRAARGPTLSGGVGLSNTRSRLERLYGSAHRFVVSEGQEGGVVVEIELPLRVPAPKDAACEEQRPTPNAPTPKTTVGSNPFGSWFLGVGN